MILMGSTAVIKTVCGGNINTNGDNFRIGRCRRLHIKLKHLALRTRHRSKNKKKIEINLFHLMSESLCMSSLAEHSCANKMES